LMENMRFVTHNHFSRKMTFAFKRVHYVVNFHGSKILDK